MESGRPDRPEVEVLDTERPPSALGRWVAGMFARRGAKVAVAAVAALVLVGVWTMLPRTDRPAAADAEPAAAADTPPGLRPPPARGRESPTGSWRVVENFTVRSSPKGHTVLFTATNRGSEAADPGDLQVTARYVDRPALTYRATCSAVDPRWQGPRTPTDSVAPRRTVLIRCQDTTRYAGAPPALDRSSIEVRRVPCESEGSSMPL